MLQAFILQASIGPLLFACCVRPLVLSIDRLFRLGQNADPDGITLFYLDDGILCGNVQTVAASLRFITEEAASLGLRPKLSKSELILPAGSSSATLTSLFPRDLLFDDKGQDKVIRLGNFEFLGAPIGDSAFCEQHASERVDKARKLLTAISTLPEPQVGLRLIRTCAGFCRLVYSARVVCPDFQSAALRSFDRSIRDSVDELTGLSLSDRQWAQAGRSFKNAGLGLRSGERHAACACIASRAATRDKCREIDSHYLWDIEVLGSDVGRAFAALLAVLPPGTELHADDGRLPSQRSLSSLLGDAEHESQVASAETAEAANLRSEALWGLHSIEGPRARHAS